MVSTCKKKQSNKWFLGQLDEFDQDLIIGDAASERQGNLMVIEGNKDRDFTVRTSSKNLANIENTVNVRTLEICFIERIDISKVNFVKVAFDLF